MLRCYLSIQLTSFYPLLCVCLVLINGTSSFSGSSYGKESGCNAGDPGLIPGSGSSPAEGNGNPLQDSCLENPMDRPWGRKESDTTERLTLSFSNGVSEAGCHLKSFPSVSNFLRYGVFLRASYGLSNNSRILNLRKKKKLKKAMVHIHNGVLLSHYKEYIWISSNEVGETGAYYTEWSKPERKTPIQYTNAYIWNLERW